MGQLLIGDKMNLQETFVVVTILTAWLVSPTLAADMATTGQSTANNAASHAIADTVAKKHDAELSRGFAKGVREAGGRKSLATEGGSADISAAAVPTRKAN